MAHALATRDLPWLGCLALVPLLRAVQTQNPLGAAVSGALWGGSLYFFGSGAVVDVVPSSLASFVVLVSAPAAYALGGAALTRAIGFSPFVLSVGWLLLELVFQPLGLSRGLLAATQGDSWLVGAIGQLLGYVLIAFVVAYTSALILALLSGVRFRSLRQVCVAELGDAGVCLWRPALRFVPCFVPAPSRPRAPPHRI